MHHSLIRNWRIDFLRGLAILSVLILHFHLAYSLDKSFVNNIFSSDLINTVAGNGNYGVTMFFVISGFLITSNSFTRYQTLDKINILQFYIYRVARIIPCLLLALVTIVMLNYFRVPIFENHTHSTSLFISIISVLTFWHNILMSKIGYFNYCLNIYWSLSVEEVFYMMFPLICVVSKKLKLILLFCFLLIIIAPIYRYVYQSNEIVALYGNFSCFDAIALGCCASIISRNIKLNDSVIKLLEYSAWLLLIFVYVSASIMSHVVLNVTLMALGTAALLIIAKFKTENKNTLPGYASRIVGWFGKISYELYLFHIIILALMKSAYSPNEFGNVSKLVWFCFFIAVSSAASWFISTFYSNPTKYALCSFMQVKVLPHYHT